MATASQAALTGINFATDEQTDATASYTSTELGVTVTSWNYDGGPNGTDWSGNGTTFAADGASIGIWHDAGGIWRNVTQAESSTMHGYLDDGTLGENYIHLTGLSSWLTNVAATSYRVTVLRSSDSAGGWDPIEIITGDVAGESGWLGNRNPTGGTVVLQPNIPGFAGGADQPGTYETPAITLDGNGLPLHYLKEGGPGIDPRGSVAGIIFQSVPEPSSVALLSLAGLALILHRRK